MTTSRKAAGRKYSQLAIRRALKTRVIGREVVFLKSTTSTNVAAKKLGRKGAVDGLVVVANHQTSGKGRSGRRWSAPTGADILASMVLRPEIGLEESAELTGMASLAVARAIERGLGLEPKIKWPNDVLLDGRKVCGILTEGQPKGHDLDFAIVGIGINCNRDEKSFRKPLSDTATSLQIAAGGPVDRTGLLADVLTIMEEEYLLLQSSGLSRIVPEMRKRLSHLDRHVTVRTGTEKVKGLCLGLDDQGRLLVRDAKGERHAFWGGEIMRVR